MKEKIFAIFAIYLIVSFSFSIEIKAQPNDVSFLNEWSYKEKLDFISDPDKFNPSDYDQQIILREAFQRGDVKIPQDNELIGKYFSSFDQIPQEDIGMANDFISNLIGDRSADLSEGRIGISQVASGVLIIDGDGIEHDTVNFASMTNLIAIKSDSNGKIRIITETRNQEQSTIILDRTTLTQNEKRELVAADGTPIDFNNNKAQTTIVSITDGKLSISCGGRSSCSFKIGSMDTALATGGTFEHLGNNRFKAEKGIVKVGKDRVFGSAIFSMNNDLTKIDLTHKIELLKFSFDKKEFQGTASRAHISRSEHSKIKGLKDDLYFSNGKGAEKIGVCILCESFNPKEYDGYVNFDYNLNNVQERVLEATIKGLVSLGFGDEGRIHFAHEGFDSEMELTYIHDGKDEEGRNVGIVRFNDCLKCRDGDIGVQIINGKYRTLSNKEYKGRNQIRYKDLNALNDQNKGIFSLEMMFPSAGFSLSDNTKYYDSNGIHYNIDYITNILSTPYPGSFWSFFSQSMLNEQQLEIKNNVVQNIELIKNGKFGTKEFFTAHTTYQFDGERYFPVTNLYVTTKDGKSIIDQTLVVKSGYYTGFLLREGQGLNEALVASKRQLLSGILDAASGKLMDHPLISEFVREILETFPAERAEKYFGEYTLALEGAQKVDELRAQGQTFEEIYKNSNDRSIKAFFRKPRSLYLMNLEKIENSNSNTLDIYGLSNDGEIISIPVVMPEASRENAQIISRLDSEDGAYHFQDFEESIGILKLEIGKGLTDSEFAAILEKTNQPSGFYVLLNQREYESALRQNARDIEHTLFLKDKGYLRLDADTRKLVDEGKVDPDLLIALAESISEFDKMINIEDLKLILEDILPTSPVEVALNLIPEVSALSKTAIAALKAKSALKAVESYGTLVGQTSIAALFGFGVGVTPKKPVCFGKRCSLVLNTIPDDATTVIKSNEIPYTIFEGSLPSTGLDISDPVTYRQRIEAGDIPSEITHLKLDDNTIIQVYEKVGSGSFGTVFYLDEAHTKVIKIANPIDDPMVGARLESVRAEAYNAAQLEASGITIATYYGGTATYNIYQYVPGTSAKSVLNHGRMTDDQLLAFADIYKKGRESGFRFDGNPENFIFPDQNILPRQGVTYIDLSRWPSPSPIPIPDNVVRDPYLLQQHIEYQRVLNDGWIGDLKKVKAEGNQWLNNFFSENYREAYSMPTGTAENIAARNAAIIEAGARIKEDYAKFYNMATDSQLNPDYITDEVLAKLWHQYQTKLNIAGVN